MGGGMGGKGLFRQHYAPRLLAGGKSPSAENCTREGKKVESRPPDRDRDSTKEGPSTVGGGTGKREFSATTSVLLLPPLQALLREGKRRRTLFSALSPLTWKTSLFPGGKRRRRFFPVTVRLSTERPTERPSWHEGYRRRGKKRGLLWDRRPRGEGEKGELRTVSNLFFHFSFFHALPGRPLFPMWTKKRPFYLIFGHCHGSFGPLFL